MTNINQEPFFQKQLNVCFSVQGIIPCTLDRGKVSEKIRLSTRGLRCRALCPAKRLCVVLA